MKTKLILPPPLSRWLLAWLPVWLLVLLLVPVSAYPVELDLAKALDLAEQHSFELKRAKGDLAAARLQEKAARAERLPRLSLNSRVTLVDDLPSLNISIPQQPTIEREIGATKTYQTDLLISLPLYTGGKIGGGVERARAMAQLNDALTRATLEELHLSTRLHFYTLLRNGRLLGAAEAAAARAEITFIDVQAMRAAGAADSVDLLEVQFSLSEARLAVSEARTALRSAEINMLILLGMDPSDSLSLVAPDEPESVDSLSVNVADTKPILQAAVASVAARKAGIALECSNRWPSLSIVGGYSLGKPNRDVFTNEWDDYFSIGANLRWSFDFATDKRVRASRRLLASARAERDRTEEALDRQARVALEELRLAVDRYRTARTQQRIAADNYRLGAQKHRQGDLSTNRMLQFEESLAAAESSLAAAVAEYHRARSVYLYAVGSEDLGKGN